jgi:hypothetical protein
MINEVLANAIDQINRDLSNPNLNYRHHGKYLRILKVRQLMNALRQELEAEWAEEDASREIERAIDELARPEQTTAHW